MLCKNVVVFGNFDFILKFETPLVYNFPSIFYLTIHNFQIAIGESLNDIFHEKNMILENIQIKFQTIYDLIVSLQMQI